MMTRYIWLNGEKIPVTQEIYEAYYRPEWRERKQKTAHLRNLSFEAIMESGKSNQMALATESAENIALAGMRKDQLYNALSMLSEDEYMLIISLFFRGKTEREIAAYTGIPNTTLHYRKTVALKKLKKILSE